MGSNVWRPIAIALITFVLGIGATAVTHNPQADVAAGYKAIEEQIVILKVEEARLEEKVDLLLEQSKERR